MGVSAQKYLNPVSTRQALKAYWLRVATNPAQDGLPSRCPTSVDPWLVPPDNPPQRVADRRRQPMRLSALFEEFCQYLRVEKEAAPRSIETYRWCFGDFESFAMQDVGGTVLVTHFTTDRCRDYLYALSARGLQTNSIRVRLAALGSLGKWAVRREKLDKNPLDLITRPRRKARLPRVPRWETVQRLLAAPFNLRERAIVALMACGGPRWSPSTSATTRRSSVCGVCVARA